MNQLTRRLLRQPQPKPSLNICPRCREAVDQLARDDDPTVNEHRLLHLAKEWSRSLEGSTGFVDDDAGLRPVAE
jgi:hypothetical protein